MSVISIRFNDEEENIVKKYAKAKGFSLSQLIKETLIEKIEEEYDLEICKEYLEAKKEGNYLRLVLQLVAVNDESLSGVEIPLNIHLIKP